MQKLQFLVPTKEGTRLETGYRVWLHIGTAPLWPFVLQIKGDDPTTLADFKSGYKLTDFAADRLAYKVMRGDFSPTPLSTWRRMAQHFVAQQTDRLGQDAFLAKLSSVPQINDMHNGAWRG
jgi:hypothetical protein